VTPARGECRLRVGLFTGCVQDVVFTPVNAATLSVLSRNGCEVVVVKEQACCGALHRDIGDREEAKALARRNIDAFARAGLDRVVTNAGGCGAAMREYGTLLEHDPLYAAKAQTFAAAVVDVSRLLAEVGLEAPTTPCPQVVTYHESCHLANVLATRAEPRALLQSIPGLTLVEMADPSRCCGSAGIYNLEHPEMAGHLLAEKMATVPEGIEVIATGNPGCAMQLAVGARRTGRTLRIAHPVELLAEAYARDDAAAGEAADA
jgi:Fe-S oxidoreductase